MSWIKKHSFIILSGAGAFVVIAVLGYIIWFYATRTCVAWEANPTGSKCVMWIPVSHTSIGSKGQVSTYTTQQCIKWKPCRRCTRYVKDENIREQIIKPNDSC